MSTATSIERQVQSRLCLIERAFGMDGSDRARVASRLRRRSLWLGLGLAVHLDATVVVLIAIVNRTVQSVGLAVAAIALAVLPLILHVWWERRVPVRRRPARWVRQVSGASIPPAITFGITGGVPLTEHVWQVQAMVALLLIAVQVVA
jgi:hypothetical protein